MKNLIAIFNIGIVFMIVSCNNPATDLTYKEPDIKILFLHHSTGSNIWYGDVQKNSRFSFKKSMCMVPRLLMEYNAEQNTKISIENMNFPKGSPYPWNNYPFDYYNIWVKNAGEQPYMEEPTLEILTKDYNVIIFKHCFPVSSILEDDETPDIDSEKKTLGNYKLQYKAIQNKLLEFPHTKFILWTGAALVESKTNTEEAERAKEFANWVKNEWDQPEDNIEIFDFREIETEGGLFLKPKYAYSSDNSHPNILLSAKAAKIFVDRIIQVIEEINLN